jgi:hypothetical protein
MKRCRLAFLTVLAIAGLASIGAASATAAPVWNLGVHHSPTNFQPGSTGEYWFEMNNVGSTETTEPFTLTLDLPPGITRASVEELSFHQPAGVSWSCPGSPGDTSFSCTASGSVPRHSLSRNLVLSVNVDPSAAGDLIATAEIEGGGAAEPATASETTHVGSGEAPFGIVPNTLTPDFYDADGLTSVREAGAHPDLLVIPFDFNSVLSPTAEFPKRKLPTENIRNLRVDLPPGFLGNPTAVGECSQAEFVLNECPLSSHIGRIDVGLAGVAPPNDTWDGLTTGVVNMAHPRGAISDLAFVLFGNPVHVRVSLDPANHYAITSSVDNINETLPAFHQTMTLWGVPAAPSHDSERCSSFSQTLNWGDTSEECPTEVKPKPFLTVPSQCEAENVMRLHHYDSWENTGAFGPEVDYVIPGKFTDCDKPRFEPDVEIVPTGKQANTPTGLDVHIKMPQNENPNALATPPVKDTVVTLPEGMSFSPSFADGLQSCSLAQMALGTNEPIRCPDASRIGEVTLSTPLLPKPAEGSMYLAAQGDNPFGSLFALYLVLQDTEERGALIKIPGRIDVDPVTGKITASFEDTPQFPFDDLTLKFRSGPRAPLVNPPSCGTQTIGVRVTSWAQPNDPVDASNTYEVTEGPNGTPCPPDPTRRPFSPKISAGTLNPTAGAYSPFVFRLSREDQEQELSRLTTILPRGLVAKLAGIVPCSEGAIASISTQQGAGKGEVASPACPASSEVGSISAGLGAGPGPNYFPGKVYLAGPYKGAPLSLAVVAPGIAGPFDLGNVVVRVAIQVDPSTAQVTAVSDDFPTILQGVILRVRDVRLRVDRPETTLNPTNCSPMAVTAKVSGVGGSLLSTSDDSLATASNPFQVGDCAGLGFGPKLSLRLFGGTKRGAHPKFRAVLRMPPGGANIGHASVALPNSAFLEQSHIRTICTRVQYAADACPAGSVYGYAVAKTPLFAAPLEGPVYLRSSSNPLPDMVAALKGPAAQPIEVDLSGRIDSVKGGIRNTFDVVPDAPVETFTLTLQGGKKGLLVNSRNLCASVNRATVKFTGQNGSRAFLRPALQNSCKKGARKKNRQQTR